MFDSFSTYITFYVREYCINIRAQNLENEKKKKNIRNETLTPSVPVPTHLRLV